MNHDAFQLDDPQFQALLDAALAPPAAPAGLSDRILAATADGLPKGQAAEAPPAAWAERTDGAMEESLDLALAAPRPSVGLVSRILAATEPLRAERVDGVLARLGWFRAAAAVLAAAASLGLALLGTRPAPTGRGEANPQLAAVRTGLSATADALARYQTERDLLLAPPTLGDTAGLDGAGLDSERLGQDVDEALRAISSQLMAIDPRAEDESPRTF